MADHWSAEQLLADERKQTGMRKARGFLPGRVLVQVLLFVDFYATVAAILDFM
ncbi:hypothetical protein SAMN05446935_8400 [Burkholderia sp. YR290]|nr:hypothetical protein SAMN05446935_8400 [Burkholderia sp. YR290]